MNAQYHLHLTHNLFFLLTWQYLYNNSNNQYVEKGSFFEIKTSKKQTQWTNGKLFFSEKCLEVSLILEIAILPPNKGKAYTLSTCLKNCHMLQSWTKYSTNVPRLYPPFLRFSTISLHHNWIGTRLLSPKGECMSCLTSCQTTKDP